MNLAGRAHFRIAAAAAALTHTQRNHHHYHHLFCVCEHYTHTHTEFISSIRIGARIAQSIARSRYALTGASCIVFVLVLVLLDARGHYVTTRACFEYHQKHKILLISAAASIAHCRRRFKLVRQVMIQFFGGGGVAQTLRNRLILRNQTHARALKLAY